MVYTSGVCHILWPDILLIYLFIYFFLVFTAFNLTYTEWITHNLQKHVLTSTRRVAVFTPKPSVTVFLHRLLSVFAYTHPQYATTDFLNWDEICFPDQKQLKPVKAHWDNESYYCLCFILVLVIFSCSKVLSSILPPIPAQLQTLNMWSNVSVKWSVNIGYVKIIFFTKNCPG